MPEPPEFIIEPGQNFSIGYPLQGDIEILENQEGEEERISENIAYENTPIEPNSYTEINNYIQKPCIRNITNKHVTFNNKVLSCDTMGKHSIEKLTEYDKNTSFCPSFLPICRIYKL